MINKEVEQKPIKFKANPRSINMSDAVTHQISLFRSQIENRRFDDATIRILECSLATKDVKSSLEIRSQVTEFMRLESLPIFRQIADKPVDHKLLLLDFLVRVFALAADVEACEKAVSSYQMNDIIGVSTDEHLENKIVMQKIKRLKEIAVVSAASRSVQAQAVEYLKKKTLEHSNHSPSISKERRCFASTLFRDGIKRRNKRKLQEYCGLPKSPAAQC